MARIKQIGTGRRTIGKIDGINYYNSKGDTFARATPLMPAKAYTTPAALKRKAIFTMVQRHLKYHIRTIRKTFSPLGHGNAVNRYYSLNGKHFTKALDALAELYVAGEVVTLNDIEEAISAFASENPGAIVIGHLDGYDDVFLTGEWPSTITLHANRGDSTIIVIVAENGSTTTHNPDGTIVVVESGGSGSSSGGSSSGSGSGSGSGSDSGSETPTVAAPVISGTTPFAESTQATISCTTAGASIYYTIDGSTPTSASTAYTEAIALTDTTTVKAIAVKDGVSSSVTSKTFTKSGGEGGGSESE